MKFVCSKTKYEDYLNSNSGIFYFDSYKGLPNDLAECEKLFDEEVLKIKKLVGDIGELKEITEDEQLTLILYDDSNLIEEAFIQRFNKQLQLMVLFRFLLPILRRIILLLYKICFLFK